MNISALIVISNLSCFVLSTNQGKLLFAQIAMAAPIGFFPPSMLLLAMLRERLRRLEEATLVAHVPPSVAQLVESKPMFISAADY